MIQKSSSTQVDLMKVAIRGDANVLITGPTGSGKTFLAKEIHEQSLRRGKAFVTVNLASLHDGTFESELFGHERGAFTGADQRRIGRLEMAQGGTVFLDEVGELPARLQARLLEFIQSRVISPVGSNREIRLDVRVIAATHRDLRREVVRGAFREDLFHRLRVISIPVRSLNERWDEFDQLVHNALAEFCQLHRRSIRRISEGVVHELERYDWPGNIRELRNVLEYAVLSCESEQIQLSDLPSWFTEAATDSSGGESSQQSPEQGTLSAPAVVPQTSAHWLAAFAGLDYPNAVARFERDYLERALLKYRGRINHTAKRIGISKATLIRRMKTYGLSVQETAFVD